MTKRQSSKPATKAVKKAEKQPAKAPTAKAKKTGSAGGKALSIREDSVLSITEGDGSSAARGGLEGSVAPRPQPAPAAPGDEPRPRPAVPEEAPRPRPRPAVPEEASGLRRRRGLSR